MVLQSIQVTNILKWIVPRETSFRSHLFLKFSYQSSYQIRFIQSVRALGSRFIFWAALGGPPCFFWWFLSVFLHFWVLSFGWMMVLFFSPLFPFQMGVCYCFKFHKVSSSINMYHNMHPCSCKFLNQKWQKTKFKQWGGATCTQELNISRLVR
jgi:hypothetical protein